MLQEDEHINIKKMYFNLGHLSMNLNHVPL